VSEKQFQDRPVSVSHIRDMARAALAVYFPNPAERVPAFTETYPHIATLQFHKYYAFVAWNDEAVVVAFRGNDEERQWIEALSYGQTRWIGGRAHGGMIRMLDGLWTHLLAALFDADATRKRIYITGHSLGGGLAVLAAHRLYSAGWDVEEAIVFGAPPVLDPIAADSYPVPVLRVVNNEDAIADVSWPTLFDTYRQVGREWYLLPSGRVAASHHSHRLARRIDRAFTIGEGPIPAGPIHDHQMERYLEKLERLTEDAG
jgi:triacylglycerol lipase